MWECDLFMFVCLDPRLVSRRGKAVGGVGLLGAGSAGGLVLSVHSRVEVIVSCFKGTWVVG